MARHEVTVAEFAAFAHGHRLERPNPRALAAPPTHPVAFVAWTDALAYTPLARRRRSRPRRRRRRRLAAAAATSGWRVTLPTEAQWEKAARGTDRRIYPWGNDATARSRHLRRVATRRRSVSAPCPECAHGLADMAGNVWEWTRSPYQPYPYDETDDRSNLDADALWVMRGGGFADPPRLVRTTARGAAEPAPAGRSSASASRSSRPRTAATTAV